MKKTILILVIIAKMKDTILKREPEAPRSL
jgi:hypothetical protein